MRECGKCTKGNRRTLEVIYNNCERWANRHVAVSALNKTFGPRNRNQEIGPTCTKGTVKNTSTTDGSDECSELDLG